LPTLQIAGQPLLLPATPANQAASDVELPAVTVAGPVMGSATGTAGLNIQVAPLPPRAFSAAGGAALIPGVAATSVSTGVRHTSLAVPVTHDAAAPWLLARCGRVASRVAHVCLTIMSLYAVDVADGGAAQAATPPHIVAAPPSISRSVRWPVLCLASTLLQCLPPMLVACAALAGLPLPCATGEALPLPLTGVGLALPTASPGAWPEAPAAAQWWAQLLVTLAADAAASAALAALAVVRYVPARTAQQALVVRQR
jgi:hypothetical protein